MIKNLCFFEDSYYKKLLPLVYLRPIYDLRTGIFTIRERILALYPAAKVSLLCRDHLEDSVKTRDHAFEVNDLKGIKDSCLFVNAGLLLTERIKDLKKDEMGIANGRVAYIYLTGSNLRLINKNSFFDENLIKNLKSKIKTVETNLKTVTYPWDLVNNIGTCLNVDYKLLIGKGKKSKGKVDKRTIIYGEKSNVFIDEGAIVEGSVVIRAEEGPVYIGSNARVCGHSVIDGPCFIGEKSIIDDAKLRPNCAIGPVCRVGGEMEEAIMQGYSNKHHEGFFGHAYMGEWVNLGAITTNSDLKNNYGRIRIYIDGDMMDCGTIKMGCFIGDLTKIGIGTLINTGTVVGVGCNIFGGGMIPSKYVPSFLWGSNAGVFAEYDYNKFVNDTRTIMGRRKKEISREEIKLIKNVYALTDHARKEFITIFSNR